MGKYINSVVESIFHSIGYKIVPSWRLEALPQTDLLNKLFKRHDIKLVLDVGANKGQYVNFLRNHLGFDGRIVSFEPIKDNFNYLLKSASGDVQWTVYDFALGSENAECELNIMKADVFSSFLKPTNDFTDNFQTYNVIDRIQTVSVRRLEDVLLEIACNPENESVYLKVDTQGFDMEVLSGAGKSLDSIRALQTEVSLINIYDNMPSMREVVQTLQDHGFDLAGMFPVNCDEKLRVIEFDAVFVNNRF